MATSDLARVVGERVKADRIARGLGQAAYANLLGVHRSLVGHVERGARNLTLRSLEELAQRMGLHPLDLLGAPPERAEGLDSSRNGDPRLGGQ